jgi:hypothetical protein
MDQVQELITASDKTPLVKILTWMFLSISVLAAIARIATKLNMVGKLRWDDYLTTISAVSTWDIQIQIMTYNKTKLTVGSLQLSVNLLQCAFNVRTDSADI